MAIVEVGRKAMRYSTRTILQVLVPAVVLLSVPVAAEMPETKEGARIALISGVHGPHQGFAFAENVSSEG